MDERRQFPRIPFGEAVLIHFSGQAAKPGHALDLSARGISVVSELPLWPGQVCQVEFAVPASTVTLDCKSWHCGSTQTADEYRVGLLFVDETVEAVDVIESYVQSVLALKSHSSSHIN